jgi:hypothetical protein
MRQPTQGGNDVKESEGRPSLDTALRAMAEDDAQLGASAGIEARLLVEVRNIAVARRRRMAIVVCAAAAVVLIALWIGSQPFLPLPSSNARVAEVTTDFMPLPYSSVPSTNVQLVRLVVPRTALVSFGLTPPDPFERASAETVLADVLVGDDGLARAVRFVRPAAGQEQMP